MKAKVSLSRREEVSPLTKESSSGWIDGSPLDEDGKRKLRCYLQRFVSEAEAIETTLKTKGFIDDLSIDRTEHVNSFLNSLFGDGCYFRSFNSVNDLSRGLIECSFADDSFLDSSREFCFICTSSSAALSKRMDRLKEFSKKAPIKTGKKKQNKSQFRRLDALFRHLRNCFAHGQYLRFLDSAGEQIWALQDSNQRGNVTARMLVKEKTLDSWVGLLYSRDKRYRKKT